MSPLLVLLVLFAVVSSPSSGATTPNTTDTATQLPSKENIGNEGSGSGSLPLGVEYKINEDQLNSNTGDVHITALQSTMKEEITTKNTLIPSLKASDIDPGFIFPTEPATAMKQTVMASTTEKGVNKPVGTNVEQETSTKNTVSEVKPKTNTQTAVNVELQPETSTHRAVTVEVKPNPSTQMAVTIDVKPDISTQKAVTNEVKPIDVKLDTSTQKAVLTNEVKPETSTYKATEGPPIVIDTKVTGVVTGLSVINTTHVTTTKSNGLGSATTTAPVTTTPTSKVTTPGPKSTTTPKNNSPSLSISVLYTLMPAIFSFIIYSK